MYLEYFNLRERPFLITPHMDFYFGGSQRAEILDALFYAALHEEGIVKVTGEVGSGKTMLCRLLINRLPDEIKPVYLSNPSLTRNELLYALALDLGVDTKHAPASSLLREIEEQLIAIYAAGRRVLLVIDEAHAMPVESLETVRLLSNLESEKNKLLRIMLYGQSELNKVLHADSLRPLRERITQQIELQPLKPEDIIHYINFRMSVAGCNGPIFSEKSIKLIAKSSQGLFRRVNILCDKALLAAFSMGLPHVTKKVAIRAIKDAQFQSLHKSFLERFNRMVSPALVTGFVVLCCGIFSQALWANRTDSPKKTLHASKEIHLVDDKKLLETIPVAPVKELPNKENVSPITQIDSDVAPVDLNQLIRETETWLHSANPNHATLQLLFSPGDTNTQEIQKFIQDVQVLNKNSNGSSEKIRVYKTVRANQSYIGVVYGLYESPVKARLSAPMISERLHQSTLQARTIKGLMTEVAQGAKERSAS